MSAVAAAWGEHASVDRVERPARPPVGEAWCVELAALVRRRAEFLGQRSYVEDARHGVVTFADLEASMNTFSRLGLRPGTTVALSMADPLKAASALVGAIGAGYWVAPLDPAAPDTGPSGTWSLARRVGADLVLADRPAPPGAGGSWWEIDQPDFLCRVARGAPVPMPGPARADATGGVVLSSSGTTGAPKVVRLHQQKLLHTARAVVAHHGLTRFDRGFNPLPLFHINAEVVGLFSSLVSGATLVLDDGFHRRGFWDLMRHRRVTWINAVPAIVSRLGDLRPGETVPPGIRFIRSASAPLPAAAADRFEAATGIPVVETYGMTEAASQITAHPLSEPRRPGSVGLPVGLDLRVVRPDGLASAPCAPGEVGEIEIRGAAVIERYEGGDHADRFRPGGWLRTGDLGRRDTDGFVYLVARTDEVINRGGEKIYPREIEEIVSADSDVLAVAVVGRAHAELGGVPEAYVVLRGVADTARADASDHVVGRIRAALDRCLVRARRPVALHVVASLPTGATGKVRRRALDATSVSVLRTFPMG